MNAQIPDDARCLGCDYALRGLPGNVCPECGRAFDPIDRTTYRIGRKRSWNYPDWRQPPPAWECVCLLALTVLVILESSAPGSILLFGVCLLGVAGSLFFLFAGVEYVLRLLYVAFAQRPQHQAEEASERPGRWRWAVLPICALLLGLTIGMHLPLRLRFALSRAAFEQAASAVLAGDPSATGPQSVGLYHVKSVRLTYDGGVFFKIGTDLLDEVGFAYYPDDLRTNTPNRLAPGWYWEQH